MWAGCDSAPHFTDNSTDSGHSALPNSLWHRQLPMEARVGIDRFLPQSQVKLTRFSRLIKRNQPLPVPTKTYSVGARFGARPVPHHRRDAQSEAENLGRPGPPLLRVDGARGRDALTSGRECVAPGRGLGVAVQAVRPQRGTRTARGETNIGGQRMTESQRRPASWRANPELRAVMRWPGESPVSAVSRGGQHDMPVPGCRCIAINRERTGFADHNHASIWSGRLSKVQ